MTNPRTTRSILALSATVLALPLGAQAGTDYATDSKSSKDKNPVIQRPEPKQRFFFSLGGGAEFDVHATKFISNGEGFLASRPQVDLGFGPQSVALPVKIQSKDFHNTHEFPIISRAEVGYQITDWLAVFGGFTYEHAQGKSAVRFGQVRDPNGFFGPSSGVYDLYANVGNYETYTGRGGVKVALPRTILDLVHAPRAIKPYVTSSAGGKYVEPSRADFYSPGLVGTGPLRLYDGGWVFTTDLQSGFEVDVTRNVGVTLESGYGYDTKLDRNSSGYRSPQAAGLSGTNRGGDRFYSTVNLAAKVKF